MKSRSDLQTENEALHQQVLDLEKRLAYNINAREVATEILTKSSGRFHSLFETMAQGVVYQSANGEIILANPAAERILGLSLDEMQHRTSIDPRWHAIHEDGTAFPGEEHPAMQALQSGKPVNNVIMGIFHPQESAYRWLLINAVPEFRADETQPYQVYTTFTDITEWKRTDDALRRNEHILKLFVVHSPAAIAMFDREMRYLIASRRFMDDYRLGEQNLVGRSHYDVFPELDGERKEIHRRCLAGETVRCDEDPLPRAEGSTDWVRYELLPWRETDGEIGGLIFFSEVITARKQAEHRLQESEKRLRLTLETTSDGFWIVGADRKFQDVNPAYCVMTGYTREEFLNMYIQDVDALENLAETEARVRKVLAKGWDRFETKHRRKDGSVFDAEVSVNLLDRESGQMICFLRDISERKRAEAELRESKDQFATAFYSSPVSQSILSQQESEIMAVNDACCRLFGYRRDELVGAGTGKLNLWQNPDEQQSVVDELTRTGHLLPREVRTRVRSGDIRTIILAIEPISWMGLPCWISSIIDITERKLAEEALLESEAKYRTLINSTTDGVYVAQDERFVFANPTLPAILGYSLEEFENLPFAQVIAPEYLNKWTTRFRQRLAGKNPPPNYQVQFLHRSGEKIWFDIRASVILYHGLPAVFGIARDITVQRQAQEKLRRSEERYRYLFENNPHPMWAYDRETLKFLAVNEAAINKYGYTRAEFLDMTLVDIRPAEDVARLMEDLNQKRSSLQYSDDWRHKLKDGEVIDVEITSHTIEVEGVDAVLVVAQDITERKQAERELRQSNERFVQLAENIDDIFWMSDPATRQNIYVSPAFETITGLSPEEVFRLPGQFLDLLLPEDRPILIAAREQEQSGMPTDIQYRIRRPDGSLCWIRDKGNPVFDENGRVVRVVGIAHDMTIEVESGARLRESEERFRRIAESIDEIFWMADTTFDTMLYASPSYERVWGRTLQSLYANPDTFVEAIHPADRQRIIADFQSRENARPFSREYRIIRPDGEQRWIWGRGYPVKDEAGQVLYLAGIAQDITERKKAEAETIYRQEFLEKVIQAGKNVTAINDLEPCLREIYNSVRRELGFDRVGLFLYDADRQIIHGVHGTSRAGEHQNNDWFEEFILDDSDWQIALQSPSGIAFTEDYQSVRNPLPESEMYGVKQHVTLAAWAGDEPVALLTVDNVISGRAITVIELEALQLFAGYAGLAIENARLHTSLEQRIRERTAEVRDLYENAPTGYHSIDANGRFAMINQTELNWLGYAREEVIGRYFPEFLTPESLERFKVNFVLFVQRGWARDLEFDLVRKDGSIMPVLVNATAIRDDAGNFLMSRSTVFDNTERKLAENALRASEARLNFLLSKTPAVIFTIDISRDLPITFISESVRNVFGYEPQQYLEVPGFWRESVHPEDRESGVKALQELIESGRAVWESRVRCADGEYRWVSNGVSMIRDEAGNPLEIIGYSTNIDVQKKAQQALQESEATYRALFENANDAIFLIGTDKQYLRINPRGAELLGFESPDELMGHKSEEFIDPAEMEQADASFQNLMRGERVQPYERTFIRLDGRRIEAEINLSLIRDGQGHPRLIQSVVRDISERKKVEQVLRRANLELERAMRMKDEFLASMSHELRTPLTGILGLSEALQMKTYGELNERQMKSLQHIETSGRHLLELINDILDLSKIEAGKFEMEFAPCSLGDVCQASLQLTKGMANKKRQHISFSIDPATIVVRADARRLKQMLVNLLGNAIKFTQENGSIDLDVRADKNAGTVEMTVSDNGVGISAENLKRLFKPFVQLDSSLARLHSGTGLGLSLVQRMTEMHGGSVRVESALGQGSQFTVVLPWSPESTQPIQKINRTTDTLRHSLTVDDSEIDAEHITRYLRHFGINNVVHPHGQGAVEIAARLKPSVVLLDLHLPDMPGFDVLSALKADPRTRDIPVIICSVEESRKDALALGASGYLVKPFTLHELRAELEKVASEHNLHESVLTIATRHATPLIMVVDDNEVTLETISDFLGAQKFKVAKARSGMEALEQAAQLYPDLILMDIQMPGLDGLETTRRLRSNKDSQVAGIPVIALTALAMPGDREMCLSAGANEYMAKPVQLKQLLETIQEMLSRFSGHK